MEPSSKMTLAEKKALVKNMIIKFSFVPLFIAIFTLLPAGTLNYWQVYAYFGVILIPMLFVLRYFLKNDPRFLERRTRVAEKEKEQKLIQWINLPIFISAFIVPGLDRRFGWSDVPVEVIIITDVVILGGYLIIFLVFRQNSYASRIIEVDKGQKVITTGLYAWVRHPMYLGVLIMYLPTPLALGSYWGLIPMAFLPVSLVFRILNEEKVLSENLEGYKEYCIKTRYRLIPYVW
ncbi:MAG: isoprenylcysteine carboxylmethyltransferase family protein [Bacteroidales bacterium]|jgi:protein-S-isoprenylcysteine O-methyltransferase Ste14|nr:isoprenylcysteine carboxylmethyltransferase family protein [Bacteroidales bacterium]